MQQVEFNSLDDLIPDEEILKYKWYFPSREEGEKVFVKAGYYDLNQIVGLLRKFRNDPVTIQYIADMLEI